WLVVSPHARKQGSPSLDPCLPFPFGIVSCLRKPLAFNKVGRVAACGHKVWAFVRRRLCDERDVPAVSPIADRYEQLKQCRVGLIPQIVQEFRQTSFDSL